ALGAERLQGGERAPPLVDEALRVVRVEDGLPGSTQRLLGREPGVVRPALVEMGGVPLRVRRPDDLGDGVGEVLVPPLRRSAELRDLGLAPLALDLLEELRLPPDLLAAPIELDE